MIPASVSIDFEVDELYTSVAANVGGLQVPERARLRLLHAQEMHGMADLERP